jgi:hypothetical protein
MWQSCIITQWNPFAALAFVVCIKIDLLTTDNVIQAIVCATPK